MSVDGKVTEEQANEALSALIDPQSTLAPEAEQEIAVQQDTEAPAPAEEPASEEAPAAEPAAGEEADDVESLRKRLADAQAREKSLEEAATARAEAMGMRYAESEKILRERFLRKSAVTDKALKLLEQAKSESGADPADVERLIGEIKGTMNPASVSYAPSPEPGSVTEENKLSLFRFLNEKRMDGSEAKEFGEWMETEAGTVMSPTELSVADRDLDAFLRIAHDRFRTRQTEAQKVAKQAEAVGAVRSVQQTQRQAARAATTTPAAPRKQSAGKAGEIDTKKLTKDDVSTLLRQSVMQYH